jgi:hypothetical protein
VLRDVSDQLALAELQLDPVMAGAVPAHERLDAAPLGAESLSAETIPATPEEIADMVAA